MKHAGFRNFFRLFILLITVRCNGSPADPLDSQGMYASPPFQNPIRFAVFSDPHYFDADLWTAGTAWETGQPLDRKLLMESPAILQATIDSILNSPEPVDFVLVTGDLTKDGELTSHTKFKQSIQLFESQGIEVYVCPGNHDINNPFALSYIGDVIASIPTVSPEQFTKIYADFGYNQAQKRDAASLSYLVEPVQGLWVIAIDSCKYENNLSEEASGVGGAIRGTTLDWIKEILAEAKQHNKMVFGILHHGLVEHFKNQSTTVGIGEAYVIDDWLSVSQQLAEEGLHLVFTGHFHAQDITKQSWPGSDAHLFDVETGSLVTYPSPYRIGSLSSDGTLTIESHFIEAIAQPTEDKDFQTYSQQFVRSVITQNTEAYLAAYDLPPETISEMQPYSVDAMLNHYLGDENPSEQAISQAIQYMNSSDPVISLLGGYIMAMQTDLPPADGWVTFNINTGEVTQ